MPLKGSAAAGIFVERVGVGEARQGLAGVGTRDRSLAPRPAEVGAIGREIHFLACVLPDIAQPNFARGGIDGKPERIAQADREKFRAHIGGGEAHAVEGDVWIGCDIRIVCRDGIAGDAPIAGHTAVQVGLRISRQFVNVDAQQGAVEIEVNPLAVTTPVILSAAVACRNIEVTVVPEMHV